MHWFFNPIFHQYATFSGRASRREFWMFVLFYIVFYLILHLIETKMEWMFGPENKNGILTTIFTLGLLIPNLAITVRRLHDLGRSGWWAVTGFLPIINLALLVYLAFPSQETENVYGKKFQN